LLPENPKKEVLRRGNLNVESVSLPQQNAPRAKALAHKPRAFIKPKIGAGSFNLSFGSTRSLLFVRQPPNFGRFNGELKKSS